MKWSQKVGQLSLNDIPVLECTRMHFRFKDKLFEDKAKITVKTRERKI